MNDPIKIIYKYKNNNKRIQYQKFIFIGNTIEKNIKNILKKIKDLDLFNTLITISKKEYKILENKYGNYWYYKLFIEEHIKFTFNVINKNKQKKKDISKNLGKKWLEYHNKRSSWKKKAPYSFDFRYKTDRLYRDKMLKKLEKMDEIEENENYKTRNDKFIGGDASKTNQNIKTETFTWMNNIDTEFDLDELEKMYNIADDEDIDKNINKTSKLIDAAFKEDEKNITLLDEMYKFPNDKDDNMYDDDLKKTYKKKYIFNQYIFKDDTIKKIKEKITTSIKLNNKFSTSGDTKHNTYILPSRMYLWSEYFYKDFDTNKIKCDNVMIGQKWIKRNELLNVDVVINHNIRTYENLRDNLRYLRDDMKKYGSKIKREEDEHNILYDYDEYITNNEIYMIDIYNELGINYNTTNEYYKNLYDIYVKIYFFKINSEEFTQIIDYLNVNNDKRLRRKEINKMQNYYKSLNNDLIIEKEIVNIVEEQNKNSSVYKNLFRKNLITQAVIHVKTRPLKHSLYTKKIDLFRIFDNYILNEKYPFLQWHTHDGRSLFKLYTKNKETDETAIKSKWINSQWFENAPYGISFKVKVSDDGPSKNKYIAINLSDNGRIEYKNQYKEEDGATIDDVNNTYSFVKEIIGKINKENRKLELCIPADSDYEYAFINTIQQFELPNNYKINHNDLSDFARYFYPYISLVIEPRKRQSKNKIKNTESKYGTYLRYKRISKYENHAKIEHRIIHFIRNYEFLDKELAVEIAKQYNITEDAAELKIINVRKKYPVIKKSRKILKKLENLPKYKPPGIDVNIQGKLKSKYKMRISGARNKEQLDRIIIFMNIFLYLYVETYLDKKQHRQKIKKKLKELTNIAKRRNKVRDIVDDDTTEKNVKKMTKLDKKRLGFKPEKGQSQWSRACQNSGKTKRRRPDWTPDDNIKKLLKEGFKYNKESKFYEKKIKQGKKEVLIKAISLTNETNRSIYYYCYPKKNGDHVHIGFLSKSHNPEGLPMPCCFKKDQYESDNKQKKKAFLEGLGKIEKTLNENKKLLGDKLYILQDTNKIQDGRFSFLPNLLNIFMNNMLNKKKIIKNHYLISAETGYYFKYGVEQSEYYFLSCIAGVIDSTINKIKEEIKNVLLKDKDNIIFTSLGNGDIKTRFNTKEEYINYIYTNKFLDIELLEDIICLPGVLTTNGLNIFLFEKNIKIINTEFEKKKEKEDYTLICRNSENKELKNYLKKDNIIIIKEMNKYFYPIFLVTKEKKTGKKIVLKKTFLYKDNEDNIIKHILNYYNLNCTQNIFEGQNIDIKYNIAKVINIKLKNLKNKNYTPKLQIIDDRNKCRYIITNNNTIIPVFPSGSIYNLKLTLNIKKYLDKFKNTIYKLYNLYKKSNKMLEVNPSGFYYSSKKKEKYMITAIFIKKNISVPIIPEYINSKKIKIILKKIGIVKFISINKAEEDNIDNEIMKGPNNKIIDERINNVKKNKYEEESYELFRLELSNFINTNNNIKKDIINIINDIKIKKEEKENLLKKKIYKIIDKKLYKIYTNLKGGVRIKDFININKKNKDIDVTNYRKNNIRTNCNINKNKNICNKNIHCSWINKKCNFSLKEDLIIKFTNIIVEEIIHNPLKSKELLGIEDYYVSDIVDYNIFKERQNQKIIKHDGKNVKKILSEIFGEDNIPIIGRRRLKIANKELIEETNENNLEKIGDFYNQNIITNNNTIFRAYVNGFYWLKSNIKDINYKNLGYYGDFQTEMSNYFKSLVIDWLNNSDNKDIIKKKLYSKIIGIKKKNYIENLITEISQVHRTPTDFFIELYILSLLIKEIPIIVLNNYNNPTYVFHNGLIYDKSYDNNKIYTKYSNIEMKKKSINIKYFILGTTNIPYKISVLYYS
jgi:hypothetical protein